VNNKLPDQNTKLSLVLRSRQGSGGGGRVLSPRPLHLGFLSKARQFFTVMDNKYFDNHIGVSVLLTCLIDSDSSVSFLFSKPLRPRPRLSDQDKERDL